MAEKISNYYVIKRDGRKEPVQFDKITQRLGKLLNEGMFKNIDVIEIVKKTISSIYPGITTKELDNQSAYQCAMMTTKHYDYALLAGRIYVSSLHKETMKTFVEKMEYLQEKLNIYDENWIEFIKKHRNKLNKAIDYNRDFLFDFFGVKTMEKTYITKCEGNLIERPQDVFMRVASLVHCGDLAKTIESYNLMSKKYFTHASPTLFNAGNKKGNLVSCFLLGTDDSINGITKTWNDVSHISKWGGGIGIHVSNIRAKGSTIRGTNGHSDGIIPMLQVYNAIARYINQCFTPETPIFTENGFIKIEDIKENMKVMTSDGTLKNVNKIFKNNVDKEILKIRIKHSFEEIKCTKEHDILTYKIPKGLNFKNIIYRIKTKKYQPKYVKSSELELGDYMVIPKIKLQKYTDYTEDDYYFLGLLLGDGHMTQKKNSKSVECGITLGNDKKYNCQEFVKEYLENKGIHYWVSEHINCRAIKWTYSDKFILTINELYDKNHEKILDEKFITNDNSKLLKLVKGLLDSDGSIGNEIYFNSTSKKLAYSLRYILMILGIPSSGHISDRIGEVSSYKNIVTNKLKYVIRIPKVEKICNMYNIESSNKFSFLELEDSILTRIISIEKENYKGYVYDLNIEDNHNYLTSSGIVHNSGKRRGSFAIYLEPHHADVFDFLELRKNTGAESERARDLFLALWVSDLFMKQVKSDGDWYLFCPDEAPGLNDVFGEKYEELYWKYVEDNKYKDKVKARKLWDAIMVSQFETGSPYITYKDNVNHKSNQSNIGVIKSSNLCVAPETLVTTDQGEIPIQQLENQKVNVWNGSQYSNVIVKKTGTNQELIRIDFKTGKQLYCTKYHKFYIRLKPNIIYDSDIKVVEGQDLEPNMVLEEWRDTDGFVRSDVVESVNFIGRYDDTYCFSEPLRNRGCFNGIVTGNCNEIVEYSDTNETAACNLASIALSNFVKNKILDEDNWTIYSKKDCPYCLWAKNMLNYRDIKYNEIIVEPDTDEYKKLKEKQTDPFDKITFPQIYNGEKLIGGMEDLYKYFGKDFNYEKLWEVAYHVTQNLDNVIDRNYYPTVESRRSNMKHRPIGLGIQGLSDTLAMMRIPYNTSNALDINKKIFGTIYHAALSASVDIAKDREELFTQLIEYFNEHPKKKPTCEFYDDKFECYPKKIERIYHKLRPHSTELDKTQYLGSYSTFEGSPFSEGKLQYHLWNQEPINISELVEGKSWDSLIESIKRYGTRNSLLTALMPTASTSQLLGNYESFEAFTSNLYTRRTLAGEFIVVNKHLLNDLTEINVWSESVKNQVILNNGSIQNLKLPKIIKDNYLTAYEMKQKYILDGCIARGPYIDQTQSMNLYFEEPDSQKLTSSQFYAWSNGLKTGLYYLRSKPAANATKITAEEDEGCLMCSA